MIDMLITHASPETSPSASSPPAPTRDGARAESHPRAPVRRGTVRVLRRLADRLEPAPRCAPQS